MKFQIKGEPVKQETLAVAELKVAADGYLVLIVNGYFILELRPNGTFRRVKNVSPEATGFQVDEKGRILEVEK